MSYADDTLEEKRNLILNHREQFSHNCKALERQLETEQNNLAEAEQRITEIEAAQDALNS